MARFLMRGPRGGPDGPDRMRPGPPGSLPMPGSGPEGPGGPEPDLEP
jgi:hypothetical protein